MRAGSFILLTTLLALLAGAGWLAYARLPAAGEDMPPDYFVALIAGAAVAVSIGVGLMALSFYSSRRGYDEPPRFRRTDRRCASAGHKIICCQSFD
jgi:hypothetical protein